MSIKTFSMQSVVGIGSVRLDDFGLGGLARGRGDGARSVPHVVAFDEVEYLVGAGVERYATPIERMDLARLTDSPELRALLYAALAQLTRGMETGEGAETAPLRPLALNVGLPVEVVMDKALLGEVARGMDRWLVGHHQFALDGVEVALDVATVRAKYSQPAGALFDFVYSDTLKVANRLKGAWVLVVDEGFNTLDVIATGDQQQKVSGGVRKGMRRASEILVEGVTRKWRVDDLSLAEADALVRAAVDGRKAWLPVHGKLTDITADVRQAVDALAAEVVRFVESRIGDGGRFDILLTGGGAIALRDRLVRRWPHARMAGNDPVMANARGFCKIAMTKEPEAGVRVVGVDPGFGAIKLAMWG